MSGGNTSAEEDNQKHTHPKISACVDCKRLKVKCVRSIPDNPNSPCMRCIKKGLECVTMGSFKRSNNSNGNSNTQITHRSKRRQKVSTKEEPLRNKLLFSWKLLTTRDDMRIRLLEKYEFASLARPQNNVLELGLLTEEQVIYRLDMYRDQLYPKYPFLPLAKDLDYKTFMATSPVLFHTILDITSVMVSDESQLETSIVLHNMVLRTVIDEIIVVSVKSLELLKCLVLLSVWYNESELYHQQRLHVLTTLAASVSYDLGMGGATLPRDVYTQAPAFEQMVTPQADDAHNTESYKVWLAVYSTSLQSLMANRIPQKSMWNKYTREAIKTLLDRSKEENIAAPGIIASLANIRHLQETIIQTLFKKDNEPHPPDFGDPSVQQLIHKFEAEIESMVVNSPEHRPLNYDRGVMLSNVFLHQGVLYTKYDSSIGRAPFTNFSLNLMSGPLSYQAVASFTKCIQYGTRVLDKALLRPMYGLTGETTNFWSTIILACDILMKCRTCCIFNKYYATACFVKEEDLGRIVAFISLCDTIIREFPGCNNAISCGFFIKLILCHHDARVHYHTSRIPAKNQGDSEFVEKIVVASANAKMNSKNAVPATTKDEEKDGSEKSASEIVNDRNAVSANNDSKSITKMEGASGINEEHAPRTSILGKSSSTLPNLRTYELPSTPRLPKRVKSDQQEQVQAQAQAQAEQFSRNNQSQQQWLNSAADFGRSNNAAPDQVSPRDPATPNKLPMSNVGTATASPLESYNSTFPSSMQSQMSQSSIPIDQQDTMGMKNLGPSSFVGTPDADFGSMNTYPNDLKMEQMGPNSYNGGMMDMSFMPMDENNTGNGVYNHSGERRESQSSSSFSPFGESYNFNIDDGVQRTVDMVDSQGEFDASSMLNFENLDDIDSILPRNVGKWVPNTFWTLFTEPGN